jgi:hypothetical protein
LDFISEGRSNITVWLADSSNCYSFKSAYAVLSEDSNWKAKNAKIFQNKIISCPAIVEETKLLSWNWLRNKSRGFSYPIAQWLTSLELPIDASGISLVLEHFLV